MKGLITNLFIEIYDNGIVLTGRDGTMEISHNIIIPKPGENAPELAPEQVMVRIPPRPFEIPSDWFGE